MKLIYSFLFCGMICMISQIVLDHSKLSPGHITSILVVLGAFMDLFHWYDTLIKVVGAGASLPICSFGHSLIHATLKSAQANGFLGLFTGMFDLTSGGIVATILFSFLFSLLFHARD